MILLEKNPVSPSHRGEYYKLALRPLLTPDEFRYDALCFWLYADPAELKRRLEERADEMLRVSQRTTSGGSTILSGRRTIS